MVYIAIICLILGIVCGQWIFLDDWIFFLTQNSVTILYLLMITVGISVGMNKQVFNKIKEYHIKILIIPVATIIASVIGGLVSAWILGIDLKDGAAIASGLGWYSLSGVLITQLAGAQIGAIAFMSNLMREILSYIMIPYVAKNFNKYTAIAPAGATSEDTTLPMLIKYTSEDVVVMAIFNGIICSAMVPILIKLIYSIFP